MSEKLQDRVSGLKREYEECLNNYNFALGMGDFFSIPSLRDKLDELELTIGFWLGLEDLLKIPNQTYLSDDQSHETMIRVNFEQYRVPLPQQLDWSQPIPMATTIQSITLPRISVGMSVSHSVVRDDKTAPSLIVRQLMDFYLKEAATQTGKSFRELAEILNQ